MLPTNGAPSSECPPARPPHRYVPIQYLDQSIDFEEMVALYYIAEARRPSKTKCPAVARAFTRGHPPAALPRGVMALRASHRPMLPMLAPCACVRACMRTCFLLA